MKISHDVYDKVKKATKQKVSIDRPIRDIANEFGTSSGVVSKIKHSEDWEDYKYDATKRILKRYGISGDKAKRFIERYLNDN